MAKLKGRKINHDTDTITIWYSDHPKPPYTSLYQNKDTHNLDRLFCLDGTKIEDNSNREKNLEKSVELSSLGHTHTEYVLRYFVRKAKSANYFVGLIEDEFREQIRTGNLFGIYQLKEKHITESLKHSDWVEKKGIIQKISYLKRIKIEGNNVLFPKNLRNKDNHSILQ